MKAILNPFTGELQLVNNSSGGGGSGNVTGVAPTTPTAIVRWVDTGGTVIENSLATVQDSGAIQAQGFITDRNIAGTIVVQTGKTWLAPSLNIQPGAVIVLNADSQLIII